MEEELERGFQNSPQPREAPSHPTVLGQRVSVGREQRHVTMYVHTHVLFVLCVCVCVCFPKCILGVLDGSVCSWAHGPDVHFQVALQVAA
jgi:hypothetical protein